jgi:hypothetical protein
VYQLDPRPGRVSLPDAFNLFHISSSFHNLIPVHDSETVTVNIPDAKPKPFAFDGNVLSEISKFHIVSFLPVGQAALLSDEQELAVVGRIQQGIPVGGLVDLDIADVTTGGIVEADELSVEHGDFSFRWVGAFAPGGGCYSACAL